MRKFLLATAMVALVSVPATPAFALPVGLGDESPELNAVCQARPAIPSGFVATATNVEMEEVSSVTVDTGPTVVTGDGSGTWVRGDYYDLHLHADQEAPTIYALQSVQKVWATATATTPTETTTTYRYSFDCHVHKSVKGRGNDDVHGVTFVAPPGLQGQGVSGEEFTVVTQGTRTETLYNWSSEEATIADRAVCTKPRSVEGPVWWTNRNGYTGECSDALYASLSIAP